jgi:iron complex transport system substrate-binding protein
MFRRLCLFRLLLAALVLPAAAEARAVTDQLGRTVTLPAEVHRVVALQHQSLDIIVELGAADRLVGVLRKWDSLIPGLGRLVPRLASLPTPGDLTSVNIEALLQLRPDVVFATNYAPAGMLDKIEAAGVPVVAISLSTATGGQRGKLNPSFADDDRAYADGLTQGVELIGEVLGRKPQADALLKAAFAGRKLVESRVAGIPAGQRVRLYMANPDLTTYGHGKYTGVIMARSGGINVARDISGFSKVSIEQVLGWNPQVVFVQDRYAPLAAQIRADPVWQTIDAVRTGRVYVTRNTSSPGAIRCPRRWRWASCGWPKNCTRHASRISICRPRPIGSTAPSTASPTGVRTECAAASGCCSARRPFRSSCCPS